ncbi:hypothetical protein FQN54_005774 [Arachnomyces sp. PD_36]|nr:hypothetical protein FQN54_005774 [Arachnomyces sp. PD_36]
MECEHLVGLLSEVNRDGGDIEEQRMALVYELAESTPSYVVPTLDAIATVLVSEPTGESVACALQVDQRHHEITITLASNESDPEKTKKHLEMIWEDLQGISEACTNFHRVSKGEDINNTGDGSPKLSEEGKYRDEITSQTRDLGARIYSFSLKKLIWRIFKPWGTKTRFDVFSELVDSYREDEASKKLMTHLVPIRECLLWVSQVIKDGGSFRGETLTQLMKNMAIVHRNVLMLLGSADLCSALLFFGDKKGFPTVKYLRKVSSLQDAINILCLLPRCPKRRDRFLAGKVLRVNVLPNLEPAIQLPQSLASWRDIANRAANRQKWSLPTDLPDKPGKTLASEFENKQRVQSPIHCECAIALHFFARKEPGPAAWGYIGFSKRSCLACWELLRCLRKNGFKMPTRGTNSKACFPWKYPDLGASGQPIAVRVGIRNSFTSELSRIYVKRLRFFYAEYRKRSDERRLFALMMNIKDEEES